MDLCEQRRAEQARLAHLNDRLALYSDQLKAQRGRTAQIEGCIAQTQERARGELETLEAAYDAEICATKKEAVLEANQRDAVEEEVATVTGVSNALKRREKELIDAISRAEEETKYYTAEAQNCDLRTKQAQHSIAEQREVTGQLRSEMTQNQGKVMQTQDSIKIEKKRRLDLERNIEVVQKELAEGRNQHTEQMEECRRMELEVRGEVVEVESNDTMWDLLRTAREAFYGTIDRYKQPFMQILREQRSCSTPVAQHEDVSQQLRTIKAKVVEIEKVTTQMNRKEDELKDRLDGLDDELRKEHEAQASKLEEREFERRRIVEKLETLERDCLNLKKIKIQLNVEIEAYKRLLDVHGK